MGDGRHIRITIDTLLLKTEDLMWVGKLFVVESGMA